MNKIIIDGKEYELSYDLAKMLKAEVAEQEKAKGDLKSPFEREEDDTYYFITASGNVSYDTDDKLSTDDDKYNVANYCRDRGMMEQRALHETLNRLLWRYSETHGGDAPWDGSQAHFYIYWEIDPKFCTCMTYRYKEQGTVYFREVATAQAAIDEVVKPFMAAHPEFVW